MKNQIGSGGQPKNPTGKPVSDPEDIVLSINDSNINSLVNQYLNNTTKQDVINKYGDINNWDTIKLLL